MKPKVASFTGDAGREWVVLHQGTITWFDTWKEALYHATTMARMKAVLEDVFEGLT